MEHRPVEHRVEILGSGRELGRTAGYRTQDQFLHERVQLHVDIAFVVWIDDRSFMTSIVA